MTRKTIVVSIPVSKDCLSRLSSLYDVIALPEGLGSGSPSLDRDVVWAVVTNGSTGLTGDQMANLPNLEFACSYGAGFENIDLDAARQRGIRITHAPNTNMETVADHALALMLAVSRDICARDRALREGNWATIRSPRPTLSGARLGMIGFGNIGQAIARRAEAFGMQVCYTTPEPMPGVTQPHLADAVSLARISDFLVVACPGGPATRHLVDRAVLEALGPSGFLVNISRGMVVKTEDLVAALGNGTIAGAGLDVFEGEPNLPPELRDLANVVITPHMAGRSPASDAAQIDALMSNLAAASTGGALTAQLA
ncbi:2-hydroxyacid dehydrogenase [Ensifer sp.]|jgi:lactate dehydrogenase-like 2-hydroxyacid dehydrogenase|uniref:2-hydroxyacid dehydrogenase n=1 Tax=Ensifer sp. TaxID=1872086 RepID=UPI002E0D6CC0|nr:2-hydroxyacid dehydrogenase [Ensifer sp.]